jgi:chromosome segregation ATPase
MPHGSASNDPMIEKTEVLLALVENTIHDYRNEKLKTLSPSESSALTTVAKPINVVTSTTKSVFAATAKPLAGITQTLTQNPVSKAIGNATEVAFITPANKLIDGTKELINAPKNKKIHKAQIKIILINQYISALADMNPAPLLSESDAILQLLITKTLGAEYQTICKSMTLDETLLDEKGKQELTTFFQDINKLQQLKWLLHQLADKPFNLHYLKLHLTAFHNNRSGILDPEVAMNTLNNDIQSFQSLINKFSSYAEDADIKQLLALEMRQQALFSYTTTINQDIRTHMSQMHTKKAAIQQQYQRLQKEILKAEQDIQQLTADLTNHKKSPFVKFIFHLFYPTYNPIKHAQNKHEALTKHRKHLQKELETLHQSYHGFNSKNYQVNVDFAKKMSAVKNEFNDIKHAFKAIDLSKSRKMLDAHHNEINRSFKTAEETFKKLLDLFLPNNSLPLENHIAKVEEQLTACAQHWTDLNKLNSQLNSFSEITEILHRYLNDFSQGLNRNIHHDIESAQKTIERLMQQIQAMQLNQHRVNHQANQTEAFFNQVGNANKTLHNMHTNEYLGVYHDFEKAYEQSCFAWELHDPFKNWDVLEMQYQDCLRQEEYKTVFSNTKKA